MQASQMAFETINRRDQRELGGEGREGEDKGRHRPPLAIARLFFKKNPMHFLMDDLLFAYVNSNKPEISVSILFFITQAGGANTRNAWKWL